MKTKTPMYDLQTVEGKNVIIPAKISGGGKVATIETCPYCHQPHIHAIGKTKKPHTFANGIVSLGYFKPNCMELGIETTLYDGTVINNRNSYVLNDLENEKLPDRNCYKTADLVDRNIQLLGVVHFWLTACCIYGDGCITTIPNVFKDFRYAMKKTRMFPHGITEMEFSAVLKFHGYRGFYDKALRLYSVDGLSPKRKDGKSIDDFIEHSNYPRIWKYPK
jgi:hypothetical protein